MGAREYIHHRIVVLREVQIELARKAAVRAVKASILHCDVEWLREWAIEWLAGRESAADPKSVWTLPYTPRRQDMAFAVEAAAAADRAANRMAERVTWVRNAIRLARAAAVDTEEELVLQLNDLAFLEAWHTE